MLTALQGISSDPSSTAQKEVEVKKGKKTETIQFIVPKQAPPSQTQVSHFIGCSLLFTTNE